MRKEILDYKKARTELISWIGLVPVEKREKKCIGDWSAKDIINHLTGWARHQNKVLNALRSNRKIPASVDVQQHNCRSVKLGSRWHWDRVYKEFLKETEQLFSNYMHLPDILWDKSVNKLIKIETCHYQGEHLDQIKKLTRKF